MTQIWMIAKIFYEDFVIYETKYFMDWGHEVIFVLVIWKCLIFSRSELNCELIETDQENCIFVGFFKNVCQAGLTIVVIGVIQVQLRNETYQLCFNVNDVPVRLVIRW